MHISLSGVKGHHTKKKHIFPSAIAISGSLGTSTTSTCHHRHHRHHTHSTMNPEKLAKLQAQVRTGGKGTPRRKVKKTTTSSTTSKATNSAEEKKLQQSLHKLGVQPIGNIEEANFFKADGNVIHLEAPAVQASLPSNTFVFHGVGEEQPLTNLFPGILPQMGAESVNAFRQIAAQLSQAQAKAGAEPAAAADDEVPELVENLEQTKI